jgi:hypothetical protein
MARCQAPNGSFFNRWHAAKLNFNRWHAAKHSTAHFLTDGTLPSNKRVIFQPMARCQAPTGSFFSRWHAAKHPTAHFLTDGTLPSSILTDGTLPSNKRVIFQQMARCQAPNG